MGSGMTLPPAPRWEMRRLSAAEVEAGSRIATLYNGDGEMIAETIGLTTTVYIGGIYEKKDQNGTVTQKKYY